jgi:hypothetical protein
MRLQRALGAGCSRENRLLCGYAVAALAGGAWALARRDA